MSIDWIALIREQGEITQRTATDVVKVLADPNLTLDQASKLYTIVEKSAQDLDRIVDHMEEFDLDEAMFEAAEALQGIWDKLSVASANKVRTMQGLAPIEFPDEEED